MPSIESQPDKKKTPRSHASLEGAGARAACLRRLPSLCAETALQPADFIPRREADCGGAWRLGSFCLAFGKQRSWMALIYYYRRPLWTTLRRSQPRIQRRQIYEHVSGICVVVNPDIQTRALLAARKLTSVTNLRLRSKGGRWLLTACPHFLHNCINPLTSLNVKMVFEHQGLDQWCPMPYKVVIIHICSFWNILSDSL